MTQTDPSSFDRAVRRRAAILAAAAGLLGALTWGWLVGLSLIAGTAMGLLNFSWMHQGIDALLVAERRKAVRRLVVKYLARLVLILVFLYAMIRVSFSSLMAALAGLFIVLVALTWEGFTLRMGPER